MSLRGLFLMLIVVLAAGAAVFAWPRIESEPPALSGPERLAVGRKAKTVTIDASDAGSGLRRIEVRIQPVGMPGEAKTLEQKSYPGSFWSGALPSAGPERFELEIDPEKLGLPDGDTELIVEARDHSWRDTLKGNPATLRIPVTVDTVPPSLQIASGLTYMKRSGAGVAVYSVTGGAQRDGVRVGEAFFKGYPHPGKPPGPAPRDGVWRAAVFAVPVEHEGELRADVVAIDEAGNEASSRFPARIKDRSFDEETIRLGKGFLERVPPPLARDARLEGKTPIETFQRVNQELRARNEQRIREIVAGSQAGMPWSGRFLQMTNSSVTSQFAELRTYLVDGKPVSKARHYGFDLASTSNAPITASNTGRVLYAGPLGIYGQTVILDHGLGITTLYAHLSSIGVREGEQVKKGQELGRSGMTGLAGGDHLHFAVLVGNTYVDPVEWWDAKWVAEHIEGPLGLGS